MIQRDLLRYQKNEVFDLIIEAGLNPSDFIWITKGERPTLVFSDSDFYFQYTISDSPFEGICTFSPGKQNLVEQDFFKLDKWEDYKRVTTQWLKYLKSEISTVSKWDNFESLKIEISEKVENQDDLFSPEERNIIQAKLETIKEDIKKLQVGEKEIELIDQKLDHLVELTEKLNKIDWFNIFIGSISSLTLSLAFTPDIVKSIWQIIKFHFENWLLLP